MEINLLPEKQIKKISLIKFSKRALFLIFLSVLVCLISIGYLYYERICLEKQLFLVKNKTITDEKKEKAEDLERIEQEVNGTLKLIGKAKKNEETASNETVWSEILIDLAGYFGDQARVEKFKLDEKDKKLLLISGEAVSRGKVIEIKNNLENSKHFSQVISPVSNLTSQQDVSFDFFLKLH